MKRFSEGAQLQSFLWFPAESALISVVLANRVLLSPVQVIPGQLLRIDLGSESLTGLEDFARAMRKWADGILGDR